MINLFIKSILSTILFLVVCTASADKIQPVVTGQFVDGVKIAIQCHGDAYGKSDVVLLYPDGKTRSFQVNCGINI